MLVIGAARDDDEAAAGSGTPTQNKEIAVTGVAGPRVVEEGEDDNTACTVVRLP